MAADPTKKELWVDLFLLMSQHNLKSTAEDDDAIISWVDMTEHESNMMLVNVRRSIRPLDIKIKQVFVELKHDDYHSDRFMGITLDISIKQMKKHWKEFHEWNREHYVIEFPEEDIEPESESEDDAEEDTEDSDPSV